MEKYNKKETEIRLAEIKADQPPEFLMTEQELKDAVIDNLPKPTICPKHNCQMEIFEGVSSKTNEPYRAYRCGISGCKEILWTDRPSEVINAEVKDIESMLGIDRPAATPAEGLEKKQRFIEKSIDRKENAERKKQDSMRDFAIKRDAAMFVIADMAANPKLTYDFEAIKQLHEKWIKYFETIYKK